MKHELNAISPAICDRPERSPRRLTMIVVLWLATVLGGVAAMWNYEFTPVGDPSAPAQWPAGSEIARVENQPTLLVFAHPQCPCTEATLDELAGIVAKAGHRASVSVLFFTPPDADAEWTQSASIRQAAAIPGVTVLPDVSGREAEIFHAATSGRTLLYGAKGELLFEGGMTVSRGHVGENAGAAALVSLLTEGASAWKATPVFGCPIVQHRVPTDSDKCTK